MRIRSFLSFFLDQLDQIHIVSQEDLGRVDPSLFGPVLKF